MQHISLNLIKNIKIILKPYYRRTINSLKGIRRIGLSTTQFTIISNNCVGGYIYQYFGIQYCTPTAGFGVHPDDFVKLMNKPNFYFAQKLEFLQDPKLARHYELRKNNKNYGKYPVANLGDIEIFFTHYKTIEEAYKKWNSRIKRLRYDKLIFLFVENEWTTETDRKLFLESNVCGKKIFLRHTKKWMGEKIYEEELYVPNVPVCDGIAAWKPSIIMACLPWKKIINSL